MRVVHVPDGGESTQEDDAAEREHTADRTILATDVEVAESTLALAKGLRFRSSIPEDYAFVMDVGGGSLGPFSVDATLTTVDMLFVRFPIDVVWLRDGSVVKVKTMRPWRSVGAARADRIVELSAGAAEDVEIGDAILVEDSPSE
ncbi:MAG: DUF192 domain-containing protein [Haloarculaceae archaeon]